MYYFQCNKPFDVVDRRVRSQNFDDTHIAQHPLPRNRHAADDIHKLIQLAANFSS